MGTKISALTVVSPALTTDEVPINRAGLSRKVTVADLIAAALAVTMSIQNTNFTAARQTEYALTATALTVTFPASPAAGDKFWLKAARTAVLSVTLSATTINGVAGPLTVSNFWVVECEYIDATEGWQVTWTPYLQGILDLSMSGAGQIKFPSSPNLSADANTLDAYVEGTFTPVLDFGGASVGITYANQSGRYRRVGSIVDVEVRLTLTAKGASVGNAHVTGFPYASAGLAGLALGGCNLVGALNQPPTFEISSTTVSLFSVVTGTSTALTDTAFSNTTEIIFGGTYVL